MKAHAFAIEGIPGDKTYCGTPVTAGKTVFAVRGAYVNCKKCKNKSSRGAVTTSTTSTTGWVKVIGPELEVYD